MTLWEKHIDKEQICRMNRINIYQTHLTQIQIFFQCVKMKKFLTAKKTSRMKFLTKAVKEFSCSTVIQVLLASVGGRMIRNEIQTIY